METKIKEIEKYLPKDWKEQCRKSKALVRGREIKTAEELLELNLLYLTAGGSFGATSALLNLTTEKRMSKKAVYTRIQNSAEWLRRMSKEMLEENGMKLPKPVWLDKDVILVDGSELCVKGSRQGDYFLHYAMNLFEFKGNMKLTGITTGESLTNYEFHKSEIVIGDRGYVSIRGMEYVMKSGADFILRYRKNAFNIYDENRMKVDILTIIGNLQEFESMSFTGFYKVKNEYRPVRFVAMKKSKKDYEKAARKIENDCKRKNRNSPKQDTLELNKYIILVTGLDYSDDKILELYRCRWQIELVFKRLKSLFELSKIPSAKPETAEAWFYGKLFLAVLCETILKAEVFSPKKEKENPEEQI